MYPALFKCPIICSGGGDDGFAGGAALEAVQTLKIRNSIAIVIHLYEYPKTACQKTFSQTDDDKEEQDDHGRPMSYQKNPQGTCRKNHGQQTTQSGPSLTDTCHLRRKCVARNQEGAGKNPPGNQK